MIDDFLKIGQQIKDLPLKIRDKVLDTVLPSADDYHKKMLIKYWTGGTPGPVTELPKEIVSDIVASHVRDAYPHRSESDPQNPILSTYGTRMPYQVTGKDGKPVIHKPGMRTAGSLGHVNLQIDPKGTGKAVMTDKWKIDPDPNYIPFISPLRGKSNKDIAEGGPVVSLANDIITHILGTAKDIDFKVPMQHKMLKPRKYKPRVWGVLEG